MDEGNKVASNGIEGAINYVERNSLSTITSKKFIELGEEEPFQTVDKGKIRDHSSIMISQSMGGGSGKI